MSGKKRRPAPFPKAPSKKKAMDISHRIIAMAEALIDDPDRSRRMHHEWIGSQPNHIAGLHLNYLACTAPLLSAVFLRKSLDQFEGVDPGEMWVMQPLDPGRERSEPAKEAVTQSMVRHLNGEHDTGQDLISVAIDVGGTEALMNVAMEGLLLLASVIKGTRPDAAGGGS